MVLVPLFDDSYLAFFNLVCKIIESLFGCQMEVSSWIIMGIKTKVFFKLCLDIYNFPRFFFFISLNFLNFIKCAWQISVPLLKSNKKYLYIHIGGISQDVKR